MLTATFAARIAQSRQRMAVLARTYTRDRDGKFTSGGGGGLTGQAALDAVPAEFKAGGREHFGDYSGGELTGPPGMGSSRALAEYEGAEFQHTNQTLRGAYRDPDPKDPTYEQDLKFKAEREADVAARVAEIDKTMAVSRLQDDVQVDRGVVDGRHVFGDAWHEGVINKATKDFDEQDREYENWQAGARPNLTGLKWKEKAYVSTSADPAVADTFVSRRVKFQQESGEVGYDGEPVVMKISVPKGTGAVQLGEMSPAGSEKPTKSAEIMLQRDLTMQVTADHGVGEDGIRRLDVAVVPGE